MFCATSGSYRYVNADRVHPEWQNPVKGAQGIIVDYMVITDYQPGQYVVAATTHKLPLKWTWMWYVQPVDATTKIIPVLRLGLRTLHLAYAVVHELHHRLQPGFPLPVFTTDGLKLYFYALTAHFGHWLQPEDARKPVWHA